MRLALVPLAVLLAVDAVYSVPKMSTEPHQPQRAGG